MDEIWQQLERTERENPAWWATEGRGVYSRLLPWLEAARLRTTDDGIPEIYRRIGTCYYQLCMFDKWEAFQKRRGLNPAREIEKSLLWDGVRGWSGRGHTAILRATMKSR